MSEAAVFDMVDKEIGQIELSEAVFGIEPNVAAMHELVKNYLANQRQGTQSALTRSEVVGGGKRPWCQKGIGHARQGSTRALQWRHGGVVFAPESRDHGYTVSKGACRLVTKSAFSSKVIDNEIVVPDQIAMDEYKTKVIVSTLQTLGVEKKALIVLPKEDKKVIASAANLQGVRTATVNTLNVYDILNTDKFIVLKGIVAKIKEACAQ